MSECEFFSLAASSSEQEVSPIKLFGHFSLVEHGLFLVVTDGIQCWSTTVRSDVQTRISLEGNETILDVLQRYLREEEEAATFILESNGGTHTLVVKLASFVMLKISLQQSPPGASQDLLSKVFASQKQLRELKLMNSKLVSQVHKLNETVDKHIKKSQMLEDQLSLQFLQVLNSKQVYNSRTVSELETCKEALNAMETELSALKASSKEEIDALKAEISALKVNSKECKVESQPVKVDMDVSEEPSLRGKRRAESPSSALLSSDEDDESNMFDTFNS